MSNNSWKLRNNVHGAPNKTPKAPNSVMGSTLIAWRYGFEYKSTNIDELANHLAGGQTVSTIFLNSFILFSFFNSRETEEENGDLYVIPYLINKQ